MIVTTTGGVYVGASINVGKRWSQHCANLKAGRCERPELQRDYDAGCDLTFRLLVECEPEHLLAEERAWIETRDPKRVINKQWSDDARSRRPRKRSEIGEESGNA